MDLRIGLWQLDCHNEVLLGSSVDVLFPQRMYGAM